MDMGWSKYIAEQEDINTRACVETAMKNGYSPEEAEECDNGDVGCPDCPFGGKV